MMRFVVLCALALAVAAAPYLKTSETEKSKVVEKRSAEKIIFGNHQNARRTKKSDPAMPASAAISDGDQIAVERELPKAPVPTTTVEEAPVDPTQETIKTAKDIIDATKPVINDDSSNLMQLAGPHKPEVDLTGSNAKATGNEMSNEERRALLARIYGQDAYIPYNQYYYENMRQAFRKKREAKLLNRASKRRSKRDLGYNREFYPYDAYDDEEIDEDEFANLLAPYIREAIRERYGDTVLEQPSYPDDGLYNRYNDDDQENWRPEEGVQEGMDDLVDAYLPPRMREEEEGEYEPVDKRSGLLSMMPGNKRFSYPYSLEPQGHWGAFVPGVKRDSYSQESYQETYDKLYELAAALARRNAYNSYLEALEAYKK